MRPDVAIVELEKLRDEASRPTVTSGGEGFTSWRARVESILIRSLGIEHHTVMAFRRISYSATVVYEGMPTSASAEARARGISTARGLIDAVIYELGLLDGNNDRVEGWAFDPELWEHVKGIVADEDWAKVASQAAILVEDRIRVWAGHPKDRNDEDLVGKGLYAAVFANDSEFRLGRRAGEWEGWRMLGMGFAQALSNVDRHRIQQRDDARRYALGVLGLGSLLLTQLRYEHSDILNGD